MAHPAADIRAQVEAAYPGAAIVERGRTWIKHQHPSDPNRFILNATLGPLHILGSNTEINSDWQATTGAWQYQMVTADFHAFSRDTLGVGTMYRYQDPASGEYVEFQPLALNWVNNANDSRQQITQPQSVVAQPVEGDILRFTNGYGSGRHFEYQAQTARLRKVLTIDAPTDLPAASVANPYLEIEFIIAKSAGVTEWIDTGSGYAEWDRSTKVNTVNRVEYRTPGGTVLWLIAEPRAWDSGRSETVGIMQFRRQGANRYCTVRIPKTWIDAAVFPIRIDPSVNPQVGTGADDWKWYPSTFDNTTGYFQFGYEASWATAENSGARFTVAVPKDATVNTAYLTIKCRDESTLDTVNATLCCVAADDPAAPTTYSEAETASRTSTVAWNAVGDWLAETDYNSPSIVTPVQAIVNRAGWVTGQHMNVYVEDNGSTTVDNTVRVGWGYNGSAAKAPKLFIDYTAAGGGGGAAASIVPILADYYRRKKVS